MKSGTPISLFSFQDIITCLTGIMIVVVLIIMLQLVETTTIVMSRAKLQPEFLVLQKKRNELLEKLKKNQEQSIILDEEEIIYSNYSIAELNRLIIEEDEYIKELKNNLSELQQLLSKSNLYVEQVKLKIKKIKDEVRKLSKEEKKVLELQAKVLSLQELKDNKENEINDKKKLLRYEFAGKGEKIPILIECSHNGFRAKIYPNGEVKSFLKETNSLEDTIPSLIEWLETQDLDVAYPVLLFRENGLKIYSKLRNALFKLNENIEIGQEPIGIDEECF